MKRLLLACLVLSMPLGCSAKFSSTVAAHGEPHGECGWFIVDDQTLANFFGMTFISSNREFHDQLYYCCPRENGGKPDCVEATWRAHR